MKHHILSLIESIAIRLQRFVYRQRFADYQKRTARARQFNYDKWKHETECGFPQNNFQNSPCADQDKNL